MKMLLYLRIMSIGALIIWLVTGWTGLQAQSIITATGGNASGGGGTVSFSVGQVFYSTYFGTSGSVSQGVQQPYEISEVTGISDDVKPNLNVAVHPNPAESSLTITFSGQETDLPWLSYQLNDLNGKLLERNKLTGWTTFISLGHLPKATYFLTVSENKSLFNRKVKTFKIIKN